MLLERCTQKVIGTYDEAVAIEKMFDALEAKIGNVPKKRRYMPAYAGHTGNTFFWEREWESLSAIEAYQAKASWDNPEWAEAFKKSSTVFVDNIFELYRLFELP